MLTTDLALGFLRAYEIYAMRWAIEVFFSDGKRILGQADCSARDFSAQISHVLLVLIRYNLLASMKRTLDYETIGGLFRSQLHGVRDILIPTAAPLRGLLWVSHRDVVSRHPLWNESDINR